MATRLPVILIIGKENVQLTSIAKAAYEATALECHCYLHDENLHYLLKRFDPDCIVTIGDKPDDFPQLMNSSYNIRRIWIHTQADYDPIMLGERAYQCAMHAMLEGSIYANSPLISIFTPTYRTGEKIYRPYQALLKQSYTNWEWVILDDSDDNGTTFRMLEKIAIKDSRVKLFKMEPRSGGRIGAAKYRAACLCNGEYLVELDHDDEFTSDALMYLYLATKTHPECGFIYSDCAEIDESRKSYTYPEPFAFGYGSYRWEEIEGVRYQASNQVSINPLTIRHIVGVPNHYRAWEKQFYHSIGGHNSRLSICDDYELVVRSFLKTRFLHVPHLSYLQYLNFEGGQSMHNTQESSRKDIQRRVRSIRNFYNKQIHERFEELGLNDWAWDADKKEVNWNAERQFGEKEQLANLVFDLSHAHT